MATHPSPMLGRAPSRTEKHAAGAGGALWLQGITLCWLLLECGVGLHAAVTARSTAILAFSSDSVVELLSALIVLAQWIPGVRLSEILAARFAAALLLLLAVVVTSLAVAALVVGHHAETSRSGLAITAAALLVMPALAALKRREATKQGNRALAADAAQSAACAWLALIALLGLAAHALFHMDWVDGFAALIAVPLLVHQAREAWGGTVCHCC